ncbi:IgGFc-binding protein [Channa argus]|uniref:IgGFc-binding protein n=1 Tax=Channa argus TaxID=215402 RepID=UPI0035210586
MYDSTAYLRYLFYKVLSPGLKRLTSDPGVTMCPMMILLLAALNSDFTAALPDITTGQNFIVAFPENIAYYHPTPPQNKVRITALYDNTNVGIRQYTYDYREVKMNAGDSKEFILDTRLELANANISSSTLQLTSNNNIAVQAISYRNNSVQTALVIPTNKLGTKYLIPPVPSIHGTTDIDVTVYVTERAPFKLIIVNIDKRNTVTLEGNVPQQVQLQPNQTAQFWIQQQDGLRSVTAQEPVTVLFGHTCAIRKDCTCGMLFTALPPTQDGNLNFFIPPTLASIDGSTFLLPSDQQPIKAFDPNSPVVHSASAVILYRPGLLLPLIADTDFAACFVVNSIPDMQTYAVILIQSQYSNGVQVGNSPLQNPQWQPLTGTDYVWTQFNIVAEKNIIWHKSSTMAVYFGGTKGSAVFGNPAPIISKTPDYRGCVLTPEVLQIGEAAIDWRESIQYCQSKNLDLISISTTDFQTHIYQKILQIKSNTVQEMWIGMRRSSKTGQWYWLNNDTLTNTNWDQGEPSTLNDGQCASMHLSGGSDLAWCDEDCCKAAYPVCYSDPVLLKSSAL